jgi:hypothetical protein
VFVLTIFTDAKLAHYEDLKTALLLLINCSQQLNDKPLLLRTMCFFKEKFPDDPEFPEIFLMYGRMFSHKFRLSEVDENGFLKPEGYKIVDGFNDSMWHNDSRNWDKEEIDQNR